MQFIFNENKEVVVETNQAGINRLIRSQALVAVDADYARTYYHYTSDELGSITYITDEKGNVVNRYEYDIWGNITKKEETISNRFNYNGQQLGRRGRFFFDNKIIELRDMTKKGSIS
ncbi:hypothetical protein [Anaerosinus massiliensis]|uniref:hypothetical protein n=1 Tax=Massilibacillus massiliensis TaxID=1806837 RepID=UPI0018FECD59|nr:hypothetical protein [Massilibacillus massiliensis]